MVRNSKSRANVTRNRRLKGLESLERREMLTAEPIALAISPDLYVPTSSEAQQLVDKVGYDLAQLNVDWTEYQAATPEQSFGEFSGAISHNQLLQVADETVAVEVIAASDLATISSSLAAIGFSEISSFGKMAAGWLPLESISDLAAIEGLNFAAGRHARDHVSGRRQFARRRLVALMMLEAPLD